jgi:8-oxo-dGTP diphosphatase
MYVSTQNIEVDMSTTKEAIQVVVAVIEDDDGHILISERQSGQHLAGLWEFPGGKVDADESLVQALKRELQEELGVAFAYSEFMCSIEHEYPEKCVCLEVFYVRELKSKAQGIEGQAIRWVPKNELDAFSFPEANAVILEKLMAS